MVKMTALYQGEKHCEVVHGPSKNNISTDAPVDNQGRGESFSPTDLVGAALASCILTTMAIAAEKEGIVLVGAKIDIEKEMVPNPRRIMALRTKVTMPAGIPVDRRSYLEAVAKACPVKKGLHPDMQLPIEFIYPD